MNRYSSSVSSAALALLFAGCTSPQCVDVKWSPQERSIAPHASSDSVSRPLFADREDKGLLRVRTGESVRTDEFDRGRRGFAVYDVVGRLVTSVNGYDVEVDDVFLDPGRYIVVSLVGEGLGAHLAQVQVVVARMRTTTVDFENAPETSERSR